MDIKILAAIISAAAAIVTPALVIFLTKRAERKAEWLRYRFGLYKEFIQSLSGVVGTDWTPLGAKRFSETCNTLHLIASNDVLKALHDFQDVTSTSNPNRNDKRHDELLSRLEWEIRKDLDIPNNPSLETFHARLWCSGSSPMER